MFEEHGLFLPSRVRYDIGQLLKRLQGCSVEAWKRQHKEKCLFENLTEITKLRAWPAVASSAISDEWDNSDFSDLRGSQVRGILLDCLLEWQCLKSH